MTQGAEDARSLAAVIVTYNRSDKLRKVLDAVLAQTRKFDKIYVVDNASTDDTPEVVASYTDPSVVHVRLPRNAGGAGGFHKGIRTAYEAGHDYFWISDDDAYPQPDALELLLKNLESFDAETKWRAPFACSRVNWVDGSLCEMNVPNPVWDWPRWYRKDNAQFLVRSCSFVSVLVARWAVKAHGLPIQDYFIWHDDVEYTMRLARSYPGLYCPDSIVIHDTPENKGVNFALVTEENLWKFKFGARNEASRQLRDRGKYGYLAFAHHIRQQMKGGKVPWRLRRQIYRSLLRGYLFRPGIVKV